MQPGGVAPPGFTFYDSHDLCQLLEDCCNAGEIVRMIIGDQYGYNDTVSIRTFTWRYDDPDPDVISYDITCRQHRSNQLPTGPTISHGKKQIPKSYTTRNGDTLTSIAIKVYGKGSDWTRLVQLNLRLLERLWIYPDDHAKPPSYKPGKESVGPAEKGKKGRQVGPIKHAGLGVGPLTYLRVGIKLVCQEPKKKHSGHKGGSVSGGGAL
jgi:hypothetical protein